mgnify:CR=1 FL=1
MHLLGWGLVLAGFWLLLSGYFLPLLLVFGLLSVGLVCFIVARMDQIDGEMRSVHPNIKLVGYFFWLLVEIVKSSIFVAKVIWRPKVSVSPSVFQVKTKHRSSLGKTVYANSITLTPGTITIDVEGDVLTVHSMERDLEDSLKAGDMDRRIPEVGD